MSPVIVVVVMILAVLFIVLSILPLLTGQTEKDSVRRGRSAKARNVH